MKNYRCSGPDPHFKNQRLVRFYNRENAFCDPMSPEVKLSKYQMPMEVGQTHIAGITAKIPTWITIIIVSLVFLIGTVIGGVYATRVLDKKLAAKNRRYFR